MPSYTATYSPEDNKLRLYASSRLDDETYQRIKAAGFKWAPIQDLFVAPMWTPEREDLLIELAGDIEPEEMTLAERAEAKAARLDEAIHKKKQESNAFHRAAHAISERFAGGQPILIGHHSERRARKDREKMGRAMEKAIAATKKISYFAYKAEGSERHANRKNRSDVRARRIKTLLSDLRDMQRKINHGHIIRGLWENVLKIEDADQQHKKASYLAGYWMDEGGASYLSAWENITSGKETAPEVIEKSLDYAENIINNPNRYRWVHHILNRLAYERNELGETKRYGGPLREVIIQAFAREHGAHKPKAKKTDAGFVLTSSIPLPFHIVDGDKGYKIELSENEWRDLMQNAGYEVPEKIEKGSTGLPPILNLNIPFIRIKRHGKISDIPSFGLTKAEYAKIYTGNKGTTTSLCGKFRVKTGYISQSFAKSSHVMFFITDSKVHDIPESPSIIQEVMEVSA